jgi:hypothetical protein
MKLVVNMIMGTMMSAFAEGTCDDLAWGDDIRRRAEFQLMNENDDESTQHSQPSLSPQ